MLQLSGSDECCSYQLKLPEGRFRLGRAADCDLVLAHPTVSRQHAEIEVRSESDVTIRDLGSQNGTFIGKRPVRKPTTLSIGESVRLGDVRLLLEEGSVSGVVAQTIAELHRERNLAAEVQRQLLNHATQTPDGYELSTYLEQCAAVGGDLYDVMELPDGGSAFIVADVAGHGFGAALLMSHILASFRTHCLGPGFELGQTFKTMSHLLWAHTDGYQFASIFLGVLEPASGQVRFVNAGHPAAVVVRAGGSIELLGATSTLAGIQEEPDWAEGRAELTPGDLLLVYTDGLIEADCDDKMYGEDRLFEVLIGTREEPLNRVVDHILDDVDRFTCEQPRNDDTALIAIRRS